MEDKSRASKVGREKPVSSGPKAMDVKMIGKYIQVVLERAAARQNYRVSFHSNLVRRYARLSVQLWREFPLVLSWSLNDTVRNRDYAKLSFSI